MGDASVDCTDLFWSACHALRPGTLAAVPGASLTELMNALQIGNPAMDSGMVWPAELLPPQERVIGPASEAGIVPLVLPPSLSQDEVVWCMDRMFACEIAWLRGASLLQTIYTSTYFGFHVYGDAPVPDDPGHHAFHAFLRATGVGAAIVWHELSKNNVVDGEDFHGDPGAMPPPSLQDISPLVAALDDAIATSSPPVAVRLNMRKTLLQLYDAAHAHAPKLEKLHGLLHSCTLHWREIAPGLRRTDLASAPSSVHEFFDVTLSRKLTAHIPLPPYAPPSAAETAEWWTRVLVDDFPIALRLLDTDSVLQWQEMLQTHATGGTLCIPYVRSLMCTFICDGLLVAGARRELEHLARDPIEGICGVSIEDALVRAEWYSHRHNVDLFSRLGRFLQRFAGLVAAYLSALAQNRAREKRAIGKGYSAWADLADAAIDMDDAIAGVDGVSLPRDTFHSTVQHFALYQLRHIVCSGFELELYDKKERACMYWLAAEICDEHALLCQDLGPLFARVAVEAHVLKALFRALSNLLYERDDSQQRYLVFSRRVKWLKRPPWAPKAGARGQDGDQIRTLWEAWLSDAARLSPSLAPSYLDEAHTALEALSKTNDAPWWGLRSMRCTHNSRHS
ncbi:N-alpha-acetyltransferase, non-catalitic subunit [Malassezia cuniculi]|uniref:N-alpha-acetyltransferase, non-catalitic subunit n=1 Tax=Malassezia cuniculi TaxID=948313 RepID=A0AAF0EUQ0_9BASI|nr:N-alpha-acetyltransferase, non-catalitic subunit [Malassezia cuniculi]